MRSCRYAENIVTLDKKTKKIMTQGKKKEIRKKEK